MKKYNIIYLFLTVLLASSCAVEDSLEPSNSDTNRVDSQIDFSNPTIKKWYDQLNTGVLFDYDSISDFAYVAGNRTEAAVWERIEIPKVSTAFEDANGVIPANEMANYETYKSEITTFLDTTLFKYFKPDSPIVQYMPHKVLISDFIYSPANVFGEAGSVLIESEARKTNTTEADLRAIYNKHSLVFGVNLNELTTNADIEEYSKDAFYIFVSRMLGMHEELINDIPYAFFEGKHDYYGQNMEALYREENAIPEEKYVFVADRDWFYAKGFIDAKYFYNAPRGITTFIQTVDEDGNRLSIFNQIRHTDAIVLTYDFIADELVDVRSYLNEMIFREATEIEAFPQNIQDNMKILLDIFTNWGIDILAVNPDLAVLN